MLGGVGLGQMEGEGYFKKTTDGLISLSPCVTYVYYWGFSSWNFFFGLFTIPYEHFE